MWALHANPDVVPDTGVPPGLLLLGLAFLVVVALLAFGGGRRR